MSCMDNTVSLNTERHSVKLAANLKVLAYSFASLHNLRLLQLHLEPLCVDWVLDPYFDSPLKRGLLRISIWYETRVSYHKVEMWLLPQREPHCCIRHDRSLSLV